jgi:hypothetical protein
VSGYQGLVYVSYVLGFDGGVLSSGVDKAGKGREKSFDS